MKTSKVFLPRLILSSILAVVATPALAQSIYATRLDDQRAVYLDAAVFGARGDGVADDSAALQAALDKAESATAHEGILFVPAGRYRITRTIYVWPGVRVIGYGAQRPVFVLGASTPGFQKDIGVMVMFTGWTPAEVAKMGRVPFSPPGTVPPNNAIADAHPSTFYSAMNNIDFEIGEGNPAAVAIRMHAAQHAFLSHMNFHVGSGLAALTEVGNEGEDLHFFDGRYGILTDKTSPAWQYTLIDSTFDGQRESAIREHEAALTLVRDSFSNVPIGIDIDPEYSDELWVKDCRFQNVSGQAVTISNEKNPMTEIGFENAVLENVPVFARFRESGRTVEGKGSLYLVRRFNYGLFVPAEGVMGKIGMRFDVPETWPRVTKMQPAIPALPPSTEWTNVHTLGVKGDGDTDDTAAIQKAIDAHPVLYFPSGHYVVKDTLSLRPDTVIIGLHPTMTQFVLLDSTPGYQGVGAPKALISAPPGGTNIVSGFGLFTGGINARAVALLWKSGANSLVDDIRFLGGHGSGVNPYNRDHTGDPDPHKRWDGQYPSLWVADGGGGTFADIWTPNTFAQSGFYVSNTKTPGHVYELSTEHHVRNEIRFDHVENWDINAPQTEEESAESPESLSLEFDWSRNITVANYHGYRVTRSRAPFAAAVRLYNSSDIHFRNVLVNAESGYAICDGNGCGTFLRVSKYPYENAIEDVTHKLEVRERQFAVFDVPPNPFEPPPPAAYAETVVAAGAQVENLENGFFSIAGGVVDTAGKLYFVDRHQQRIFGWSEGEGLTVERDNVLDPVNLAIDKAGDLLVVSSDGPEGTVYDFHPGSSGEDMKVIAPTLIPQRANAIAAALGPVVALPVNYWNNGEFRNQLDFSTLQYKTLPEMFAEDVSTPKSREYVSPDGSLALPAGRVFVQGPADYTGWRFSDNLDTYGLIESAPGRRIYVESSSEDRTYSALVNANGTLTDLKVFAERGGESVAEDAAGNVYVANGQVFVYDKSGKQIALIQVPERPLQILFGGADRRTLFILAHHALFAVKVRSAG
jgi:hypothetical protein